MKYSRIVMTELLIKVGTRSELGELVERIKTMSAKLLGLCPEVFCNEIQNTST